MCTHTHQEIAYRCSLPFEPSINLPGLVVQCSDGRFGQAYEQFLASHLRIGRGDRLVVPGGPGALIGYPGAALSTQGILEDLEFLVTAHSLKRAVLITHDECGFYLARRSTPVLDLPATQRADMAIAADLLRDEFGLTHIEAYRAAVHGDHIEFETVPV